MRSPNGACCSHTPQMLGATKSWMCFLMARLARTPERRIACMYACRCVATHGSQKPINLVRAEPFATQQIIQRFCKAMTINPYRLHTAQLQATDPKHTRKPCAHKPSPPCGQTPSLPWGSACARAVVLLPASTLPALCPADKPINQPVLIEKWQGTVWFSLVKHSSA